MSDPEFYHVSQTKLALGLILLPQRPSMLRHGADEVFERNRPGNRRPRDRSIYIVNAPEFHRLGVRYDEGYAHVVSANDVEGRFDLRWIGIVELRLIPIPVAPTELERKWHAALRQKNRGFDVLSDDEIGAKYWSGEASDDPRWEFSASQAKVERYFSEDKISLRGQPNVAVLKDE